MDETISSILRGTVQIWLLALAALLVTLSRRVKASDSLTVLCLAAVSLHCAHFAEEFLTGLHLRFPALLGLAPWPAEFFVTFNLAWVAIWALCIGGLMRGFQAAAFPLWFLALAMMVNCIAHPLLALVSGGYFPGLLTSPLTGWMGVLLWRRLWEASSPEAVSP